MNNQEFEKVIKYEFKDISLLDTALTHSSYVAEKGMKPEMCNERLEFLGDAAFDAIVGEALWRKMPVAGEGTLTKARAGVVCQRSLAEHGRALNIGKYIKMGKGELASGGSVKESIIADATEAVIGSVFLDGGYESAKEFVLRIFGESIEKAAKGRNLEDYKTRIQERATAKHKTLKYKVVREEGPDHAKKFFVELHCDDMCIGRGQGTSKKEAENNAAKAALERGGEFVL